jgi:hypothetical protein
LRTRAAIFLILAALALACTARPELCRICEREIHPGVRADLTLVSGRQVAACCPRCALHYRQRDGDAVRAIEVTDRAGGRRLPIESAFLVEGSDETPCLQHPPILDETRTPMHLCYDRCMPSLIAFASAAAAQAFVEEHGGVLHPPGTLPEIAAPAR